MSQLWLVSGQQTLPAKHLPAAAASARQAAWRRLRVFVLHPLPP